MKRTVRTLLLAMLAAAGARAEDVLKLEDLIREAIQNNPSLQSAQKRVEAARQRPRQEGALPDPMISAGYSSVGVPLPGFGLGREPVANIGVMVTQEVPYPGKRALMAARAGKEADAELAAYWSAERTLVSRVKQAYHKLNHAYEALEVMERSQKVLAEFIKLSETRYSTGKAMQQDIFRAQSQLAIMETRIVKMQQDRDLGAGEINAMLHRPVDAPLGRPQHSAPAQVSPTLTELTQAAETSSPMIAREQKMAEARQYGVSLARKNYRPDFAVTGGYFNMGAQSPMYEARLDIKLPARRAKYDAALAEQVHSLEQARRTYEATAHEVRWQVRELYVTTQTSWRLLKLYEDSVMPQAELATASSLSSYETGALASTEVLMNLMTRFEQEERYHEEMLNYFTAVIRLEELTGLELQP